MNEIELLLTEEFAVFSKAVAAIHEEKKLVLLIVRSDYQFVPVIFC